MTFNRITLFTDKLLDTKNFYSDLLEFPFQQVEDRCVSFKIGSTTLVFEQTNDNCKPIYHFAINVPGNLFESAFKWMERKHPILPFDQQGKFSNFKNWNANSFYFFDNQHNIVEVISHFDLPDSKLQSYAPEGVLGINEIGIPVADVPATCIDFESEYGIQKFHKGPILSEFVVLGTESAMLIITKEGRPWLPTDIPAQPFPIIVEGNIGGNKFKIQRRIV